MTIQPRKQRKAWYNAPLHIRRKQLSGHLSEELLLKYNRRSLPVITGDEVKVLRGDAKGKSGAVISVDTKHRRVTIEGITHKKADGTDVALAVDPSNLVITRLNLEDQRRRDKLGETVEAGKAAKGAAKKAKPAAGRSEKADSEKAPAKGAAKEETPQEPQKPEKEATA